MTVWTVFLAATITALFTGLGALPLLFVKKVSKQWLGAAQAAAAGLMLGASIGLIIEGARYGMIRLGVGLALGLILVVVAHRFLENRDAPQIGALNRADVRKMLLLVGVMTVHSFAEGVGVGVSFGGGQVLGSLITTAIAIHNIPEGLAISLLLVPRGTSVARAAGWSIFSSLPQPLMAVLAYLFVLLFQPFLPVGLGLAAGAMIWMVFSELMPGAEEQVSSVLASSVMGVAMVAMIAIQVLIS